ncbi:MAG: dihydroorotate dehydrogenase (quinone), partial [Candidatus Limnocylindria bacterium]
VILSNTTLARDGLRSGGAVEEGGLSGRPLLERTFGGPAAATGHGLAVVASGGISSGEHAARLRAAGADLVQLWTGLIYAGPGLIGDAVAATREAG